MSPAFDLQRAASDFARWQSRLLTRTVCDGITLTPVLTRKRDRVVVAYGITKQLHDVRHGIPLALGGRKLSAFLSVY